MFHDDLTTAERVKRMLGFIMDPRLKHWCVGLRKRGESKGGEREGSGGGGKGNEGGGVAVKRGEFGLETERQRERTHASHPPRPRYVQNYDLVGCGPFTGQSPVPFDHPATLKVSALPIGPGGLIHPPPRGPAMNLTGPRGADCSFDPPRGPHHEDDLLREVS